MPTTINRDEAVELLAEEFAAVSEMCRGIDEAAWNEPTCLPGWTVKDVLSHMAATERMLEGEHAPQVDVSHLTHLKNDIAKANEMWVEANRPLSGAEVLAQFEDVTARRLAALAQMTQGEFDAPSWTPVGRDETYGRFMRIRHYDCFLHEHDIRDALSLPERDEPRHVSSALDETATALGYIVGRRARMPADSRVRIQLLGSVAPAYLVAVDERAVVVTSFESAPTVGITLPEMLWLRLTGGRLEAGPRLGGEIALEGDVELAKQLATNLSYTI
jgi:uncharacterized protein (TIGR03083 family)